MEKILTVCIAAYNMEKYIEEALNPFLNKTIIDDLEIFIIDDGGTDSTLTIAKKYQEKYPETFKLVHKKNGGWGSVVNYGIQFAAGKYFKQLDGDDFFSPDELEKYIQLLKKTDCDLIWTPYRKFENGTNKTLMISQIPNLIHTNVEYKINEVPGKFPVSMHCCTFKTSALKNNVVVLENCFYTDNEYALKALANVNSVIFSDLQVYQYRMGRTGQSMSLTGLRKHYPERQKVLRSLLEFQKNMPFSCSCRDLIEERIHRMVENQYMIFLYLEPNKEHKVEMIEFDRFLAENYPEYYTTKLKKIRILRALKFTFYSLISRTVTFQLYMLHPERLAE